MSSKTKRIQNYLRENRITELFEEMMHKLVLDLPASPLYYLANFLGEKEKKVKQLSSAVDVREDKYFHAPPRKRLQKAHGPQIVRGESLTAKEKQPEISENAKLWATAPLPTKDKPSAPDSISTPSPDGRKYDKPWLAHTKKSQNKHKSGSKLSQSLDEVNMRKEIKDDVIDGSEGVDLGLVYSTPKRFGEVEVKNRTPEEELASELPVAVAEPPSESDDVHHERKGLSEKEAKRRRAEELRRMVEKKKSMALPRSISPITIDDQEDEALELLEDPQDLMDEGVKNPPRTGVVLGRSSDRGKEQIDIVLNMSKFFDELGGMEGVNQNQGKLEGPVSPLAAEEDDFESASQVTGPRRPVWEAPDTEVESVASRLKSARLSGMGVDTFVNAEDVPGSRKSSKASVKQAPASPRPHTAPSKPRSNVSAARSQGPESPAKVGKSPRSRPTTPKTSRPATPKGSQIGSARASRRASQASNASRKIADDEVKNGSKKEQGE